MRNARNLAAHELIGLVVRVLRSPCPTNIGKRGKVVDETKNTLVLEMGKRTFTISKQSSLFGFELPSGETCLINGDDILYAPEERTKRLARKVST